MKSYQLMFASCLLTAEEMRVYISDQLNPLDKLMLLFYYNFTHEKRDKGLVVRCFSRITEISEEILNCEFGALIAENLYLLEGERKDEKGVLS